MLKSRNLVEFYDCWVISVFLGIHDAARTVNLFQCSPVNDVRGFGLFSLWLVEVHIGAILQNLQFRNSQIGFNFLRKFPFSMKSYLNRLLLFFSFNNSISILGNSVIEKPTFQVKLNFFTQKTDVLFEIY